MKPSAEKQTRSGTEVRKRQHATLVRWGDDEFAYIDEAASKTGQTVPSYIREIVLPAAKRQTRSTRRPPIEREIAARILGQLGKIGSNFNQIAKAANSNLAIDRDELAAGVEVLVELRRAMLMALGRKE